MNTCRKKKESGGKNILIKTNAYFNLGGEMKLKNDQQNYGLVDMALHWLIAVLTYGLFGLGLWMVDLGYYDNWYQKAPTLHEGFGVLLFMFVLIKIRWKWNTTPPESLASHKQWEKTGAHLAQRLFNILLLVIAISGYLIVTAKGDSLNVFNLFSIPASLSGVSNQADLAGEIHWLLAWILVILSSVHVIAALKHHFIDKDKTLKRMLNL